MFTKWFDKVADKVALYVLLKKNKAERELTDSIKEILKKKRTEERMRCYHDRLKCISDGSMFYQCSKCRLTFMLVVAPSWTEKGIVALQEELKNVKITKKGLK